MRYISLIRGINVGGHKKIRMADLKSLYESLGFKNVVTYIQSGNVIFDSEIEEVQNLKMGIENAISETYCFQVPVEIRTHHDLDMVIRNNPFGSIDEANEGKRFLVAFLSSIPHEDEVSEFMKHVITPEKAVVTGKEIFLHYPNGVVKSKLTIGLIERKLGVRATARNWRTVVELYKLSS